MAKSDRKDKDGKLPVPQGYREVFSRYITLRNGRRLYAAAYGLEAFRFLVRD